MNFLGHAAVLVGTQDGAEEMRDLGERPSVAIKNSRAVRVGSALGATLVVVLTALAVLLSSGRPSLPAGPSASPPAAPAATVTIDFATGRWGWTNVTGERPATIARVANGFLGACTDGGLPAVCTSRDALVWATPPDPGIFRVSGGGRFTGWQVAVAGSNWVAASPVDGGVWHSADGVVWSPVSIGRTASRAEVQTLGPGFALFVMLEPTAAQASSTERTSVMLTSPDGLSWSEAKLPDGAVRVAPGCLAGVFAFGEGDKRPAWVSRDGKDWQVANPPNVVAFEYEFASLVALPAGGFIGQFARQPGIAGGFFVSSDGIEWSASDDPGPDPSSLVKVGDYYLAIARVANNDLSGLFESVDGTAWVRAAVVDGTPLAAGADRASRLPSGQLVSLGDRVALFTEGRLAAVGGHLPSGVPLPTSTPSPSASPSPGPVLEPIVAGGWRWHSLGLAPDYPPVKLQNGYLGSCGTAMCTSTDGWTWRSPADPAIFSAGEPAHFTPVSIAHRPGGNYVMTAEIGVWYSDDGVRWRPGEMPGRMIESVLASAEGFAALVYTEESVDYVYLSSDGDTWTRSDLRLPVYMAPQHGVLPGWLAIVGAKFNWMWTTDGRHWTKARLPSGGEPGAVFRLPSGGFVTGAFERVLRSTDGASWSAVGPGGDVSGLAVVRDRIIRLRSVEGSAGDAIESSDGGKTFHVLLRDASVEQFGDLLLAHIAGSSYVGEPLSPDEVASTTPTPTRPRASPTPYAPPTPQPAPAGGISKDEALRIAIGAVNPPPDVAAAATATATNGGIVASGRWVWEVNFTDYYAGPLNAQGRTVEIDYFTGEVIRILNWIS